MGLTISVEQVTHRAESPAACPQELLAMCWWPGGEPQLQETAEWQLDAFTKLLL